MFSSDLNAREDGKGKREVNGEEREKETRAEREGMERREERRRGGDEDRMTAGEVEW